MAKKVNGKEKKSSKKPAMKAGKASKPEKPAKKDLKKPVKAVVPAKQGKSLEPPKVAKVEKVVRPVEKKAEKQEKPKIAKANLKGKSQDKKQAPKEEEIDALDFSDEFEPDAEVAAALEEADIDEDNDEAPPAAPEAVEEPAVIEVKAPLVTKKTKKDVFAIDREGDLQGQWQELFDKSKGIKPVAYKMSEKFEAKMPVLHRVLGWGFILSNQNDRLEVLFKDGIKVLISNYKP